MYIFYVVFNIQSNKPFLTFNIQSNKPNILFFPFVMPKFWVHAYHLRLFYRVIYNYLTGDDWNNLMFPKCIIATSGGGLGPWAPREWPMPFLRNVLSLRVTCISFRSSQMFTTTHWSSHTMWRVCCAGRDAGAVPTPTQCSSPSSSAGSIKALFTNNK